MLLIRSRKHSPLTAVRSQLVHKGSGPMVLSKVRYGGKARRDEVSAAVPSHCMGPHGEGRSSSNGPCLLGPAPSLRREIYEMALRDCGHQEAE